MTLYFGDFLDFKQGWGEQWGDGLTTITTTTLSIVYRCHFAPSFENVSNYQVETHPQAFQIHELSDETDPLPHCSIMGLSHLHDLKPKALGTGS